MRRFEAGSTAYTANGEQVDVVAAHEGFHVVRRLFEDNETGFEETYHRKLYRTPPVGRLYEEVRLLREEIAQLQKQAEEGREAVAERERLSKVLRENEALRYVEDVLANRITHFLVLSGYGEPPHVATFDEAMKTDENNWQCKLRLLTLHGRTGGDLRWRINHYTDGSGSLGREVIPFPSKEAADHALRAEVSSRLAAYTENPEKLYGAEKHVAVARQLGIEVSIALITVLLKTREQGALRMRENAQDALAAAEALLGKVKQEREEVSLADS